MLKIMQSDESKIWSLDEVLSGCDWSDQAVAVGAGLGLSNLGFVETLESSETEIKKSRKRFREES